MDCGTVGRAVVGGQLIAGSGASPVVSRASGGEHIALGGRQRAGRKTVAERTLFVIWSTLPVEVCDVDSTTKV
ncbi:hypothetical protein PHMEG_00011392 [Phytophthora megakarya]|uniref:Uncharacterized protein n=1 Tax=Phytophthora megakarya TaxID=4795 RepID=A0A225WBD8_9STRA|nr:hypothetical protein PHMEG_00011392 [Phytophthora megakarya]